MQQLRQLITIVLCCCCLPAAAQAQGKATRHRAELGAIFRRLTAMDGYTFEGSFSREIVGDTTRLPGGKQLSYVSCKSAIAYMRAGDMEQLICPKGQFTADLKQKKIVYMPYTDSMAAELRQRYGRGFSAFPWDSLLLEQCTVTARKQQQQTLSYALRFAPGSMCSTMQFRYNTRDSQLLDMSYMTEREMAPPVLAQAGKGILVRARVTLSSCRPGMPPGLQERLSRMGDLRTYLEQSYPGFSLQQQ